MSRHGQNRTDRALLRIALLGLTLSLILSGCTVLGLAAGSIGDASSGKGNVDRLLRVREGTQVTMWMHDGSKVQGKLVGFSGLPDSLNGTLPRYLPPGSGVVLAVHSTRRTIAATEVSRVSVPASTGKLVGTTTGLLVDAALVFLVLLAASGGGLR